ncbi:NAD-dependent succinate-semialdehyde dehydrogenase [Novosphingobium sp. MW5]|nr:NAD-dependent succinate-semialdehyde dehydrogenase [Novosphingobium sp. MW5]
MKPQTVEGYTPLALYIAGEWTQGSGTGGEAVLDPALGSEIGWLPHATSVELDAALASADRGFAVWRKSSPQQRCKVLGAAAALLRERGAKIARICALEEGKTIGEAMWEINFTADRIEWLGEEAKRLTGTVLPKGFFGDERRLVPEPVGPVLAMSPWNLPIMMPGSKIACALAAGCSVIVKPSEETPGTGVELVRCFVDAGVPANVINLVYGAPAEVSTRLIESPVIRKVSFTGPLAVGKLLYRQCADGMKKMTMELGGHAPVIVFDDVDVDAVVAKTVQSKFSNAGQMCIAPTRFYVHDRIADAFAERFTAASAALKVGNGLDKETQMGPLANARRVDGTEAMIADALDRGAKLRTGGKRIGNTGFFFEPTVLSDVPNEARPMWDEPFGPIAMINRWDNLENVIAEANRLPFALGAYAFTRSQKNAQIMTEEIETGMIAINMAHVGGYDAPFGGIKESGIGRESGAEGLREYLDNKLVTQMNL